MGASVLYIVGSMTPLCYRTYFGSRVVAIASCGFTSCYDIITWSGYYIIRWLCCYIITWAMSLSTCVGFYFNCNWIKHVRWQVDSMPNVCVECIIMKHQPFTFFSLYYVFPRHNRDEMFLPISSSSFDTRGRCHTMPSEMEVFLQCKCNESIWDSIICTWNTR